MRTKSSITLLTVLLLATLVVACAPSAAPLPTPPSRTEGTPALPAPVSKKLEKVKVQTPSFSAVFLPYYVGRDKGFYKEVGIDLEAIAMKAPLAIPALLAGETDFTAQASSIIQSALKGVPVKLVMQIAKTASWHIMVRPEIATPADLKGRTVAVTSVGKSAHYATAEALKKLGLDPTKDVVFVSIPEEAAMLQALKAGSVHAASVVPPFELVGKDMGFRDLFSVGDLFPLATTAMSTTESKLRNNPDQVKRVIRATLKSLAYMREERQGTIDFIIKEFGVERKVAESNYEDLLKTRSFDGSMGQEVLDALVGEGIFTQALTKQEAKGPLEKAIDFTFLKEVQKELNLPLQKDLKWPQF